MSTGSNNGPAPAPGLNSVIDNLLSAIPALNGFKTYLAAAGLLGLALYQVSTDDFVGGYTSFMAALAAVGIRHAISKSTS
ncbi:MAG: hypothetical protein P4L84_37275 [Isosphaeraceae bacterium]|nr:hypothetical protein [Isosphaeraceae bacterium]